MHYNVRVLVYTQKSS